MRKTIRVVLVAGVAALVALGSVAAAEAADFSPASGTYTVDTTALTLTGPGTSIAGADVGGVAVFSFDNVNIPAGVTINATGSRPLKFVASGALALAGTMNGSGGNATRSVLSPVPGGPGGGVGGAAGGAGPGGGGAPGNVNNGGGGGGFGGVGAAGGLQSGNLNPAGAGGAAYGDLNVSLQGGSAGGAGAFDAFGAGGGGAIALFGSTVTISPGSLVLVDGGGGDTGTGGASGGGSGGAIVVHGDTVEAAGLLVARGGPGGAGGCCGDGGGGAGGRIAFQYRTLVSSGTTIVSGGTSGARSTGGFGHGGLSPNETGAAGVVTRTQDASAVTGPATAVSSTAATLNGTVNPRSNATSYSFEFGTSSAYASLVPSSPVAIGADAADHVVSQTITSLTPNTTYHYRLVATDAMGFRTAGADVGFTTALAAPGANAPDTKITKKKINSKNGEATFKFKAVGSATAFQCVLVKKGHKQKGHKLKFTKCRSPKTYKNLSEGSYSFQVRALNGGAADPRPAKASFEIK
jgi:hypothetical protein